MSATIAPDDVLIVEWVEQYVAKQQIAVQRRMWLVDGITGVGAVTFQDVATALDLWVASRLRACMANEAVYLGARVRRNFPVGTDQWAVSTTSGGIGTGGAGSIPAQVCPLITLLSDQIGKASEGRIYLPFPPVASLTVDGDWTAGMLTAIIAVAGRFAGTTTVAGTGTAVATLVPVLCRYHVDDTIEITGFRVGATGATQRRRSAYGRYNKPPF